MSDNVFMNTSLLSIIEETLRFNLVAHDVLQTAHELRTNWIVLPTDVVAFIPQGRGEITFRESGKTCQIGHGCAILSPGGMVRKNCFLPERGQLVIHWAHVRYEIMRGFNLLNLFRFPKVFDGSAAAAIGQALKGITSPDSAPAGKGVASIARGKALGMELLAGLTRECALRENAQDLLNQYRSHADIIGHIEDHLREKITVADLAKLNHLSVSRFHRVFKSATGRSPTDFIIDRRVQTAKRLLSTTTMSLSEIADAAGFSNAYYFSRMFKRFEGASPSAYRQSLSNENAIF